jgi:hypothetical protein
MENDFYTIGRIVAALAVIAMFVIWVKQTNDDTFPPDSYP